MSKVQRTMEKCSSSLEGIRLSLSAEELMKVEIMIRDLRQMANDRASESSGSWESLDKSYFVDGENGDPDLVWSYLSQITPYVDYAALTSFVLEHMDFQNSPTFNSFKITVALQTKIPAGLSLPETVLRKFPFTDYFEACEDMYTGFRKLNTSVHVEWYMNQYTLKEDFYSHVETVLLSHLALGIIMKEQAYKKV